MPNQGRSSPCNRWVAAECSTRPMQSRDCWIRMRSSLAIYIEILPIGRTRVPILNNCRVFEKRCGFTIPDRFSGFVALQPGFLTLSRGYISSTYRVVLSLAIMFTLLSVKSPGQNIELKNATLVATFDSQGLTSIRNAASGFRIDLMRDAWLLSIDNSILRSGELHPAIANSTPGEVSYDYETSGYHVQVTYRLAADWTFVSKQIRVLRSPGENFTIHRVVPWDVTVRDALSSDYVPSTYVPQLGATIEKSRDHLPGKDLGEFLRLSDNQAALLVVQNP